VKTRVSLRPRAESQYILSPFSTAKGDGCAEAFGARLARLNSAQQSELAILLEKLS
jgi:hypothetical protein